MNLHCSALNRQQQQLHSVFNCAMKNVLLSRTVFIYYFLAEAPLSARARNPRLTDYNSWTSVWSRVQYQRGGLSACSEWGVKVLRLHPALAQYPLISSSRPDGWCRREYASLYYVKKKKKKLSFFQPGQKIKLATPRLHLGAAFDFSFSQMQWLSGGQLHDESSLL